MFLSFCIITIGDKPDKLRLSVESIRRNFTSREAYEIDIIFIEDNEYVEFLGKRRNIATDISKGDILIHFDDDIIFPLDWVENFKRYDKKNKHWEILGNKILLPDGKRHWDRATYFPLHQMVDYDYESDQDVFYQTGGFCVVKKTLLEQVTWSNDLPFYAKYKGFEHNEDIDFSLRLNQLGKKISFDKDNTVWHYDYSYRSDNKSCNKKPKNITLDYKCLQFACFLNNIK